jgi:hypothetical protein
MDVAVVSSAVDVVTAPTWEHVLLSQKHARVELRRSPIDVEAAYNYRPAAQGSHNLPLHQPPYACTRNWTSASHDVHIYHDQFREYFFFFAK